VGDYGKIQKKPGYVGSLVSVMLPERTLSFANGLLYFFLHKAHVHDFYVLTQSLNSPLAISAKL
jgi:hypothetical protein